MAEWIMLSNPNLEAHFKKNHNDDWIQESLGFEVNDIVYVYVSGSVEAIRFKCEVISNNTNTQEKVLSNINVKNKTDDSKLQYMRLKLLNDFEGKELLSLKNLQKHGINGDIQDKLRLSNETLDYINNIEKLINVVRDIGDVDEKTHSYCYEMTQEVVNSYSKLNNFDVVDYNDGDLLLYCNKIVNDLNKLNDIISNSNLTHNEKERLTNIWNNIKSNINNNVYTNKKYNEDVCEKGMFTMPTSTLNAYGERVNASCRRLIELLVTLNSIDDEYKCLKEVENYINENNSHGIGLSILSQILHCFKPKIFPIINKNTGLKTIYPAYITELEDIETFDKYISNTRLIKEFKENNFSTNPKITNYRTFDLAARKLLVNSNVNQKEGDNNMSIRDMIKNAIEKGHKQIVLTGAPGTSKTYSIREFVKEETGEDIYAKDKKFSEFVQFHPSYDYSDFVEGIRPVVIEGKDNNSFVRIDGIFKAFCRKIIEENITKPCYFIVDEINRADLSKVFGELMFSLEKGYRKYRVQTQFSNIPCYKVNNAKKAELIVNDCFEDGFYVPENLIILGSMNDIDRSVSTFDFALRRRFEWINIDANETMKETLKSMTEEIFADKVENVAKRICNMNKKLIENNKFGLNKDYYIGAAYFKDLDYNNLENSLEQIFDRNIKSIIKEYTRGRNTQDIDELLNDCRKALLNINE